MNGNGWPDGKFPPKFRRPRRPKTAKQFRARSFKEQNGLCYYCRKTTLFEEWTTDHKTPLCRGGMNHSTNKVGCCDKCNLTKANMTEDEFSTVPAEKRKAFLKTLDPRNGFRSFTYAQRIGFD